MEMSPFLDEIRAVHLMVDGEGPEAMLTLELASDKRLSARQSHADNQPG